MTQLSDVTARYGAVAAGLVVGTLAKYGLAINDGKAITWRGVVADALLLGILGLIAIVASDWAGLTGNMRVMAGALAAVSSDRLVRLVRRKFEERAEVAIDRLPGAGAPRAQPPTPGKPRRQSKVPMRAELRTAYPVDVDTPEDIASIARRLGPVIDE